MATNGGNINFNVNMTVNKNGLNQIVKPLQQIQRQINSISTDKMSQEFQEAVTSAKQLESIINSSWNDKLGQLNLDKFNQSIKNSYGSVSDLKASLSGAGAAGEQAFNNLAHSILNTNLQLRQSNKLLDDMATSMANTVKWGITSSIFNKITGSIQSAYYYAKDLDSSLNNIRIVTGQSADEMQRFAKVANNAAGDLGRSTLDYTKAALTFYQQGLNQDQVQARTQVSLKAQNITGAGSEIYDELTSVWNGFKVATEDTESVVDKLAAVADNSASNMSQLATAMSKVAATANVMGVDVDQLTAQLSTVIATTRMAPESVGTAFKTIYSRLNDIQAGAEEAQISLGNYSGKMADLGFNVLDATGHLRDTGQVIEEIGGRWQTLTKEQQVYLAQTMGGQRQITQVMALFDNWDKYLNNLNVSMSSQGTLMEKNNIYLESTEAHLQRLSTQAERTYDILFDQKIINNFVDAFDGALKIFNNFISGLGGGTNVFVNFGSIVTGIFNKQIAQAILNVQKNFERFKANVSSFKMKGEILDSVLKDTQTQNQLSGINISKQALRTQAEAAQKIFEVQKGLTNEQYKQTVQIQKQIGLTKQKILQLEQEEKITKETIEQYKKEQNLQNASVWKIQAKRQAQEKVVKSINDQIVALNRIEQASQEITLTERQRKQLAKEMGTHYHSMRQTYEQMGGDIDIFNNSWKEVIEYIRTGKGDLSGWHDIEEKLNAARKQSVQSLEKIDYILKNSGIDVSKLTAQEKERLSVLLRQNDAYADQGRHVINIQNLIKGISAAGQVLSAFAGSAKVLMDETSTGAEKANAAFSSVQSTISAIGTMFGPLGMGVATLVNGAISLVKEITPLGDILENYFKSTAEKAEELSNNLKESLEKGLQPLNKKRSLENLKEEFEELSKKTDKYGLDLSQMTQQQQDRYKDIVNEIATLNPGIVQGYTDQNVAIINNNDALDKTIQKLQKQYELQQAIAFSDANLQGAKDIASSRQEELTTAKNAQKDFQNSNFIQNYITENSKGINFVSSYNGLLQPETMDSLLWDLEEYSNQDKLKSIVENTQKFLDVLQIAEGNNEEINSALKSYQKSISFLGIEDINLFIKESFGTEDVAQFWQDVINLSTFNAEQYQNETESRLQVAVELAKSNLKQAQNTYKTIFAGALKWNDKYNSAYKDLQKKFGEKFEGTPSQLFDKILQQTLNNEDLLGSNSQLWGLEIENAINEKIKIVLGSIDLQSLNNLNSQLEKLLIKSLDEENPLAAGEYEQKLKELIQDFIKNSPDLQEVLSGENEQNKQNAISILETLFGVSGLQLGEDFVVKKYNESIESVLNRLKDSGNITFTQQQTNNSNYIKENPAAGAYISGQTEEEAFDNLIRKLSEETKYSEQQIQQYLKFLSESGQKVLASQLPNKLVEYFEGIKKASEDTTNDTAENLELLISAVAKLQDDKTLSYKEKVKLVDKLSLTAEDVQDADRLISILKEKLDSLGDSQQDLIKRSEALPLVYNSFEKIAQALNSEKISEAEANILKQEVFDSQLETLDITQEKLKQFAEARKLAFTSIDEKQQALGLYQQAQAAEKLAESKEQEAKARRQATEAAEEDTLRRAKAKQQVIPNATSGLEKLQQHKGLTSDQSTALAYLEETDQKLKEIAEAKGRDSKEYTEELQKQLQIQADLTEKAKQEQVAVYETKIARAEQDKAKIEKDLVSEEDYSNAKQFLNNQDNWSEGKHGNEELERARELIQLYQSQSQKRAEIAKIDQEILGYRADIIQVTTEETEAIEQQNKSAKEIVDTFNDMGNTLTSGGELSTEQMQQFEDILNNLLEEYPELQEEADLLKETWLAGTQAYSEALGEVGEALDQLMYKEIVGQVDEAFSALQDDLAELERLDFEVDPSDFDQFVDQVQTFLDADKTIAITVHTDAENEFNRITQEMENIYQAAGKIGQNFIVAANDMRELNNVFPGILEGMQQLDDGSFQLNSNMVKRAIATAQSTVSADAESVVEQLKHQSTLLHEKASTYQKMAEAAKVLAGVQTESEMTAEQAREEIVQGLTTVKAKNAELAAKNEVENQAIVADSSKDNSQIVADNWAGSAQSSANSIYEFARSAVDNFNSIAETAAWTEAGYTYKPWLYSPSIRGGYTGTGGVSKQTALLGELEKFSTDQNYSQEKAAELIAPLERQAQIYEKAANDIDGMIAQTAAQLIDVGKGLDNVVRGQSIKGSTQKDTSSKDKSSKTPSTKTTKEKEPKKEKETKKKETKKKETKKKQTKQKEEKVKEEKIKDPDVIDYLQEEAAWYHDIDIEIKAIARDLDKVQKIESKLFGKDLINNLNQQVNILESQIQAYQTKIDLANQEKTELQYTLGLQGVLFDEDTGVITNYNAILNKHLGYVNTVIDHYNRMTAEQQEKYKDTVEEVKDNYELFKERIQNYDKIVNDTIPQLQEEIRNNRDEQIEKTITKFTMAVEIELDLSQAKKDWNEFKKNIITKVREDDIVGNANANLENFFAYYDKGSLSTGLIPGLTDQVMETINQLNQINSLGSSSAYGDNKAQALEDLQKYSENLMNSLQDVEDVIKQVKESFYDMVDAAQEAFDEQEKEYEFLSDLIEHDKKLIQMLYGDDALDKINEYNQKQIETDKRELQFQRQQKDFWWAKMQAERVRLEYLDKESDAYKQAEKRFKDLEQHWLEAVKDFNSEVEESIQHLLTLYQNNVSIIFQDLEKTLTNGKGLDYIEEEWELINDNADDYLDTINSMYQIQKLQEKFDNAIEDSRGNLKAQKSLTDLMNQQLKMLKDKDKLTQYDVDRANLLLQIEIKRLALQQSRSNKTKLRLRRDSQGNYNYQYTSDENQISEAEQNVTDLQNDLYNLDKDEYIKNQNEILKVQKDFNEKMKQLYEEHPIWTEQAEQKKQMLIQQYGIKINGLVERNQTARVNLSKSAFDSLKTLYGDDAVNFDNLATTQREILMQKIVPQWSTSVEAMTEKIAGQGGLLPVCQTAFIDLDKNTKQYEAGLVGIEQTAGVSFNGIKVDLNEIIFQTKTLIDDNKTLISKYNEQLEAVKGIIGQVNILTQAYTSAKLEAIAAASAANNYLNIERSKAITEAKAQRENISKSPVIQTKTQTKPRTTTSKAEIQEPEELLEDYYFNYPVENIADDDVIILEDSLWNTIDVSKSSKNSSKKSSNKNVAWEKVVYNYHSLKEGSVKKKENLKYGGIYADQAYQLYMLAKHEKKTYGKTIDINDYRKSMGYKTGGYTGQWGNEGKIGILHEKELVLNAEDTKNILAAVESTRTMANLLKLINTNNALSGTLSNLTSSNISSVDQNVHITATFPSVNSRVEIEQAFSNLINRASQYSFNTRK